MKEKLSFDCIALSEKEERLLWQIKNEDIPDVISSESLERLFRHNLVENSMRVSINGTDSEVYMKAVLITNYGRDYLAYVRKLREDRKRSFRQNVFITILSSLLGALLSQPVWDLLNSLLTRLQIS